MRRKGAVGDAMSEHALVVSILVERPAARSRAAMAVAGASSSARCSSGKTVALYGALMGVNANTVRC